MSKNTSIALPTNQTGLRDSTLHRPSRSRSSASIVTLGIFLLLAARNPSAHRSLIAFTAWSSFAHAILMAGQAFANLIGRGELIGSAVLVVIGIALIALAPAKQTVEQASAVVA